MSVSDIPDKIKLRLWVKSGGNCQYDGCNIPLWKDELTQADMNKAYIAHIYAKALRAQDTIKFYHQNYVKILRV